MPIAKLFSGTAIHRVYLLAFLASMPAAGQNFENISKFRYIEPVRMSLVLPMDGPSASLLNPARLGSAERGYADIGSWGVGNSRARALSAGAGLGRRFYLGMFLSTTGETFEQTNAVIINNRFGGQFAYRHSLGDDDRGSFTIGIGEANRFVNSLGDFKTFGYTFDLGAILVPSAYPGGLRLEFGCAARDLLPFRETVLDRTMDQNRRTHVDFAPWMTLTSFSAESPAQGWMLFGQAAVGARYEPALFDQPLPGWNTAAVRWYLPPGRNRLVAGMEP